MLIHRKKSSIWQFAHEQTIICRQLFAGHVVGSRPMKRKKNLLRMIIVNYFPGKRHCILVRSTFALYRVWKVGSWSHVHSRSFFTRIVQPNFLHPAVPNIIFFPNLRSIPKFWRISQIPYPVNIFPNPAL